MQAWDQFLRAQETELGKETVQRWLRSLKVLRFDACNLYLEAKDPFQLLWFEEHVRSKVQLRLVNGNQKKIKVHLSLAAKGTAPPAARPAKKTKPSASLPQNSSPLELVSDPLDPRASMKNFIFSTQNFIPQKVLQELLEKFQGISDGPNPIYLYGKEGCGKSHLLMGIAREMQKRGIKAMYVHAETFTDHVVQAIRAAQMSRFRELYRKNDLLLVDDVHIFSRKGTTQEEFFHTFNTLHLECKQIILSANTPPQELEEIEPRLVSRFEWGIVLPLVPLEGADRKELLHAFLEELHLPLEEKIVKFLLEHFSTSPKILLQAVQALVLRLNLRERTSFPALTEALVRQILQDLLAKEEASALHPEQVLRLVAEECGVTTDAILGKSQVRELALPRQIAMHFCREILKMPYPQIGSLFDRNHSTVISSVKNIQKGLDQEEREIATPWHAVRRKIH